MFLIKGNRFITNGGRLVLGGKKSDNRYYTDEYTDYKYMTVVALEDGLYVTNYLICDTLYYCIDQSEEWVLLEREESTPTIKSGQTISLKGTYDEQLHQDDWGILNVFDPETDAIKWILGGKFNLSGNCNSLIFGDDADNEDLINNHTLPLGAYSYLFGRCEHDLIKVSRKFLPSKRVGEFSYDSMFQGCTSLSTAPELPATTLADSCYISMFTGCISLLMAPELPATTLAGNCYAYMFIGCTSLVNAPELLATTLEISCYNQMFMNCSSLNYIKMLASDNISIGIGSSLWVYGVSPTGTFVKSAGVEIPTGVNGIPEGWTVQEV